jgi:hypothetical protein
MGAMARKITIQLDKPRTLLFNMNSMIAFRTATGQSYMEFSRRAHRRNFAYACKEAPEKRKAALEAGDYKLAEELAKMPPPNEDDLKLPELEMEEIRAMLWCLLIHEDKSLTLEDVGALITFDNLTDICNAMVEAQTVNSPESKKGESKDSSHLTDAPQA